MADPGKVAIVERDIEAVFASYLILLFPTDLRLTLYYLFYVLSDDAYQGLISGVSTGDWVLESEAMGSKDKFWYRDGDGPDWLFKFPQPNTGQHWSEKIAAAVADGLNILHAQVELAVFQGRTWLGHGILRP